jgi:hypothetical protein
MRRFMKHAVGFEANVSQMSEIDAIRHASRDPRHVIVQPRAE